ncbi:4Fe-4S binding protein [Blautia sp.]|uniref:Ferredoxin n=1 Tax=Blautia glucerasea TaxID=536633 RepID=A0A6N2TQA2_9FIRM
MAVYKITFSPTGGTDRVTDILAEAFSGKKKEIDLLSSDGSYDSLELHKEDVCFIAMPSYGGRIPKTAAERLVRIKGGGAKAVLVCVYGNRAYEDTLIELKDRAEDTGFIVYGAVAAVAEHSIMRKFAAGRPDEKDREELWSFGKELKKKLEKQEPGEISVPGNHPYKKLGTIPFIPKPGRGCNSCGYCARFCPVGAIDPKNVKNVDEKKCISCMRCVSVCPKSVRKLNKVALFVAEKKMAKLFEERKENQLFL